jgi:predicted MFS family arabinose efflux permease
MYPTNTRLWSKSFIILMTCNFLLFFELHLVVSPLTSYVQQNFDASAFQVSLFICLFALSAIGARLYSARALARGLRNKLIYSGLLIALAATIVHPLAGSIFVLLLLRMVFGAGFGLVSTAFPTMASNVVPMKRMGEGMGYFGLSTTLAMSLGPIAGAALLHDAGFPALMLITAATLAVIVPLSYTLTGKKLLAAPASSQIETAAPAHTPRQTETTAAPAPASSQIETAAPALAVNVAAAVQPTPSATATGRRLVIPSVLNGLLSVTYGGLVGFIILFGQEKDIASPALFFLFNAIAVLIVRPLAGKLYDRKGPAALLIPGALFVAAGLVLLSFATTIPSLLCAAIVYGIGYGSMQSTLQTWMIQSVNPQQRGLANGLFLNSLDLGIAVGALALGVIASLSSYAVMYRYSALFMALFLIIYIFKLRKPADGSAPFAMTEQVSGG